MCACDGDYAEGYGPTAAAAEKKVFEFWRKGRHKVSDVGEKIHEVAVDDGGGSRYVELSA